MVLSNRDLLIGTQGRKRILFIDGTYDSSLGSDLALRDEVQFYIDDLTNVP